MPLSAQGAGDSRTVSRSSADDVDVRITTTAPTLQSVEAIDTLATLSLPDANTTPELPPSAAARQARGLPLPAPRPFDPSYGYTLERLLAVQPPVAPADFQTFWRARYQAARAVAPKVSLEPAQRVGNFDLQIIRYNGVGDKRLGAYLVRPKDERPITNAIVYGHGYGGCGAPNAASLAQLPTDTAALFVCVRGFGLSADPLIPGDANKHVVTGIEDRETYAVGTAVSDIWSSANALLAVAPSARDRLYYDGTSFGGGIGALALAQDTRFAKAVLEVPTFGDQPLRATLPTNGSGQAVRRYLAQSNDRQKIMGVLAYYDAGSAARFIRTPTLVIAARADGSVAPPGQFAVYNALGGPKKLHVASVGHAPRTDREARAIQAERLAWFATPASDQRVAHSR